MNINLRSVDKKTDRRGHFKPIGCLHWLLTSERLLSHRAEVTFRPSGSLAELSAGADGLPGPDGGLCLGAVGLGYSRTETEPWAT
jgi:hypothetical protein